MKITIKNISWEIIKTLDAQLWKTLYKQITDAWIEIHHACNTWICWACMCQIETWGEFLNKSFKTEPGFPLDESEVMTCIAWVDEKKLELNEEIILKTIY